MTGIFRVPVLLALLIAAGSATLPRPTLEAAAAQGQATQCEKAQPWPSIATGAAPNSTYEAAKKPVPQRFRGAVAGVHVDFMSAAEVNRYCAGGILFCTRVFYACAAAGKRLTMPNPCDFPAGDAFAALLCHELAHINGWPATHGD